jgi:hypothetical protein
MRRITGTMMRLVNRLFLAAAVFSLAISFYGCALTLKPKFTALRDMPPEAFKAVEPADVEVMEGEPPVGVEYIEMGYITIDETKVSPIMTMSITDEDIITMIRREAANRGADAVIKFRLVGDHPARKANGLAIVYRR